MAKKKRNPNLSQETLARARRELYGTTGPVTPERAAAVEPAHAPRAAAAPAVRPVVAPVDLRAQYAYVVHDLRNMGILAAIFMTVLVVLSFII